MLTSPGQDHCLSNTPAEGASVSTVGGWQVHAYPQVPSTNLMAASLPAWHAVRADIQTQGRGRFQRDWVSDAGGLWISGNVPVDPKSTAAPILPLTAGLALCGVLRDLGVTDLYMRWPNDLLVGRRKLAGLLIDRFVPGIAVVGIGLNVTNHPEERDPALRDQAARLADLLASPPPLIELTRAVLQSLRAVWDELHTAGPNSLLPRINALWRAPVPVALDLDGPVVTGDFLGVDSSGRLELRVPGRPNQLFEPHHVRLLRELP